jgi:hypothetical protein
MWGRAVKSAPDAIAKHRVKYRVAGQAMRETLARANALQPRLGVRDRAVLEAVLVVTVSYSKLCDFTTARELACIAYGVPASEIDGRDRERVRESLNKLRALGLIDITPTGKGRGARVVVSVRAPRETPLAVVGDYEVDEEETPPAVGKNAPHGATETPPASAAHLEDLEEFLGEPDFLKLRKLVDSVAAGMRVS